MIPLAQVQEERLTTIDELEERLSSRAGHERVTPLAQLSLSTDGLLQFGAASVAMTEAALASLLSRLRMPWKYAAEACDTDLLVDSVNRLSRMQREEVRIHVVEGKVVSIGAPEALAVPNRPLVAYCKRELAGATEIVLAGPRLRITVTERTPHEVMPGDAFEYGWELTNCAAGSSPLSVRAYALRQICSNGTVARQNRGGYRRNASKSLDVMRALDNVRSCLQSVQAMDFLETGLRLAHQTRIGPALGSLEKCLRRIFGDDGYGSRFADMTEETNWYEVYNRLTRAARMYSLAGRRTLEELAGDLVEWFASGGYERGEVWRGLRGSRWLGCAFRQRWLTEERTRERQAGSRSSQHWGDRRRKHRLFLA